MAEQLVTIYRFHGSAEAYLWKEKLKTKGINSTVVNDINTGAALPDFELRVREKDAEKALSIIKPTRKPPSKKFVRLSAWLALIFGVVFLVPGILLLVYQPDQGGYFLAIICLLFAGLFLTFPVSALIKKK